MRQILATHTGSSKRGLSSLTRCDTNEVNDDTGDLTRGMGRAAQRGPSPLPGAVMYVHRIVGTFAFLTVALVCTAASAQSTITCGDTAQAIPGDVGAVAVVTCPAGCGSESVWGAGTYSDDSAVCAAAIHAGVVDRAGGSVQVTIAPGLSAYPSTTANGVTTSEWGSWGRSFIVAPAGGVQASCQQTAQALTGDAGTEVSVTCPAGCAGVGSVWGGPIYSDDSAICRAAVHAGVIGNDGGSFTVTIAPGQSSYPSNTANGVTTSAWGSWGRSFTVR